ncbi:outer membrane transport energization protein ExbB [Pseudomonas mucidolens]|uniref:Outer membrane transport energization protein ExbB n=1 Tax=Pseudomonas mucidolens TaxID=46679 RepID=A0A1H2MFM8_9PSED|nr:MotA/TolQ/ExbB proton channel family protein [Pseudomonas mucidolens]SDU92020.1 outer membrane transport energization protein ExbB [Pseudomonas mucidolens]
MQRLFLSLLICLGFALPATAHAWWQDDWHYRKQISVDTTPQGAAINQALGRTALLIRLHTGNFTFDGVKDDGADLRFVSADDKTVFNHQIESFDPLMGMALIWVDVPKIEGAQRQDIWMYYGNQKAPATANGQLTFDPDYIALYHFDTANGTPARDTTAYGNTALNATGASIDGVIGRALQFSGEPMVLPASPSLQHSAAGAFTFSAWLRLDQAAGEQVVLARREGTSSLLLGLNEGTPFVEIDGQRAVSTQPLNPGQWQHLAFTAVGNSVTLYVNGRETASLALGMPAFNSQLLLGADLPEAASGYLPFSGAMDELRLSKVARSANLLLADANAQGAESKLVAYGVDEEQSGFGFGSLGFLLKAVPVDAWVIILVLVGMMIQSWFIMYRKNRMVSRVSSANEIFREEFAQIGTRLEMYYDDHVLAERLTHSSLWRLYRVAVQEIRTRRAQGADTSSVSAATIEAIRCSMDGVRTRENQMLSAKLSTLSNAIAGGPYIGLLGTVLGIMVVFLGTAMAGDVNINAIAPGMAAALLATAMGLFVAIPALFGYNRLITRNKEVSADMWVFVDEFITRLAEMHGESQSSEAAHRRGHHANVPA